MINVSELAVYGFVMSITPGPNNIMLTLSGASHGFRSTLPLQVGIVTGFFLLTAAVCLGLGAFFQATPWVQPLLGFFCGAYVLVLAWRLVASANRASTGGAKPLTASSAVLLQFGNPKGWIMAITVATLFLPKEANLRLATVEICSVLAMVSIPCVAAWAAFGASLQRSFHDPRKRFILNASFAVALVAIALLSIAEGVSALL